MDIDDAFVPVRRDWLHRVVNDVQVLADPLNSEPFGTRLQRVFQNLPPPATKLESIILRGLMSDVTDGRNRTPPIVEQSLAFALRARDVLETRFGEAWPANRLARTVGCNRTVLDKAFKQLTQLTIHEFLTRRRVAAAQELLVATGDGLKTIADRVGVSRVTLTRQFRHILGLPPGDYRRRFGLR